MAEVAALGPLASNYLHHGDDHLNAGNQIKRKTPSELRGEQLKRKNATELVDESPASLDGSSNGEVHGLKKPEILKTSRYIDNTSMDAIYPARKPTYGLKVLPRKANTKENASNKQIGPSKLSGSTHNVFPRSEVSMHPSPMSNDCAAQDHQTAENCGRTEFQTAAEERILGGQVSVESPVFSCQPESSPQNPVASASKSKGSMPDACGINEKVINTTFRSVAELSLGNEKLSGLEDFDMDIALKGLSSHKHPASSSPSADSSALVGDLTSTKGNSCTELHIPVSKIPLDFTLKTTMWVLSSTSVNWFHRLIAHGTYNGLSPFSQLAAFSDQDPIQVSGLMSTTHGSKVASLHSWVYPQSTLPPSIVSALASSATDGEMDFLNKRQSAWEDSFRNLYYMLRKSVCHIFYVCASHFVVMFTINNGMGKRRQSCSAYISRSTRGLRSLLREHDIDYSMPLCHFNVNQATTEDLVELSEIERQNLGQTRRLGSMHDMDNSPESLLAFNGNASIHGLYDFLLNYRHILSSLTGLDVPALYSPVPFKNAALCTPEVRCKEMKKADHIAFPQKGSNSNPCTPLGLCHSIEIKGLFLPPWIVSSICAAMASEGRGFEASVVTDSASVGLNAALDDVCPETNEDETLKVIAHNLGIQNVVRSPSLRSAVVKSLKYCNGAYTVLLSPV